VGVAFTLVSFHAHPDDEALLTGGTLARLVAEGHRVVVIFATAGGEGLTAWDGIGADALAALREAEARRAAGALGCTDVRFLGFADSGMQGESQSPDAFTHVDVDVAARRLAAELQALGADAVTTYDAAGGYGHPDHVRVHEVGLRAAQIAGTPLLLEATVDRTVLLRVLRVLRVLARLRLAPPDWQPDRLAHGYSPRAALTHRVDVRPFADRKRAAMAAHVSQTGAPAGRRTLAIFLRLPSGLFRRVFGHEWFIERGRATDGRLLDDVFATLRDRPSSGHG
jgi:LmbE family N-acetylglucosaminyl deacetylase